MKNVKLCAHRIERYKEGTKQVERIACVEDYLLALATYSAACRRWPDAQMSLRRGPRLVGGQPQKARWLRRHLQLMRGGRRSRPTSSAQPARHRQAADERVPVAARTVARRTDTP